jgi:hypothetical protein
MGIIVDNYHMLTDESMARKWAQSEGNLGKLDIVVA